jgi:5-methylcytosine-specific restriction endonuclease McrA
MNPHTAAAYNKLRKQYLQDNPTCFYCGSPATVIHHTRPRKTHLLDVKVFKSCCAPCERAQHHPYSV